MWTLVEALCCSVFINKGQYFFISSTLMTVLYCCIVYCTVYCVHDVYCAAGSLSRWALARDRIRHYLLFLPYHFGRWALTSDVSKGIDTIYDNFQTFYVVRMWAFVPSHRHSV
jgi:hypothetical protein